MKTSAVTLGTVEQAADFIDAMGIDGSAKYLVRTWSAGWQCESGSVGVNTALGGLAGKYPLHVLGLATVRFAVLDIDDHDLPAHIADEHVVTTPDTNSIDDYLRHRTPYTRRVRSYLSRRLRRACDAARELGDELGFDVLIEGSPRGIHLIVMFQDPLPVTEARAFMVRLESQVGVRSLLPAGASVEIFPKIEGEHSLGRMCRLPLTGPGTLLADDLETVRYRHRSDRVTCLLTAARATGHELDHVVLEVETSNVSPASGARNKADTSIAKWEKATGPAFTEQCLDALDCIPLGASYECMRKITWAAFVGYGMSRVDVLAILKSALSNPKNTARAATDPAEGRQFITKSKSYMRRLQRDIDAKRLAPKMQSFTLRARLEELATHHRARISEIRSAAVAARWARLHNHTGDAKPCPTTATQAANPSVRLHERQSPSSWPCPSQVNHEAHVANATSNVSAASKKTVPKSSAPGHATDIHGNRISVRDKTASRPTSEPTKAPTSKATKAPLSKATNPPLSPTSAARRAPTGTRPLPDEHVRDAHPGAPNDDVLDRVLDPCREPESTSSVFSRLSNQRASSPIRVNYP